MAATRSLRLGLLGASKIAPRAVLGPASARTDVKVSAVAARDGDRAETYARTHGIDNVARDYRALIGREDVDLVYNALPPGLHCEWTLAALEAGKGVLCEKPFALNAGEAIEMAAAAEGSGGLLIEAYHYRHHRVMHEAVALMASGRLGAPLAAEARFDVPIARTATELRWQAALGGGALMDLGCYPLHALRSLLVCEPVVRRADARFVDGVDAEMRAELDFGGAPAVIACSMVVERPAARLAIECQEGAIEIVNFVAPQIGCRFSVRLGGVSEVRSADGPSTYEAQLDDVVRSWRGEKLPLLSPEDAVAQMRAIDAIYAAARRTASRSKTAR